ncbi:MAG: class 1 fructose-bisphosphatase [Candidatus Brocadia sp.]|nr:MAG: class 1 fructose-bisphosphatase [Candidatus Brocadia sp.]
MQKNKGITIQRHIVEQERLFPKATGDFTGLLWDLSIAAKLISREVNKAGLAEILGLTGEVNVHGEAVKKLDVYANERICKSMDPGGHLCIMASEENEDVITIPDEFPKGKYVLMFDPLDGSSNIDANVSVGTIFSIYRRKTTGKEATIEDCLRKGTEQVAAGYIVYGSSTMMVYTTGQGVYGFTLDPSIGEFLLSHENIKIPEKGKTYSINEGNTYTWDEGTRRYIGYLKESDSLTTRPYSLRYIGSLVADFHRNLLYGGIFLYPADYKDPKKPNPKLRLLYEAAPLAFIVEQAGGMASTGKERIMDIQATELHQKVPLVIGSKEDVLTYEKFFNQK